MADVPPTKDTVTMTGGDLAEGLVLGRARIYPRTVGGMSVSEEQEQRA